MGTSGGAYIGKFLATGGFSFRNIFEHDALYNVLMYELEDNMPYYPVDDKSSGWNRQEYLLNAGLSSPVLWDRVSFGVKVDYTTKVGAKQLDPRGETYKYSVTVKPSVAVLLGQSLLGLSGTYTNGLSAEQYQTTILGKILRYGSTAAWEKAHRTRWAETMA